MAALCAVEQVGPRVVAPAILCCPVTTIVFGVLHKAQRTTCTMAESALREQYQRKNKPIPGRVLRVLNSLLVKQPYLRIRINPALVAKFLAMYHSLTGKKLLRLMCDDSVEESIAFESIAIAIGMVRAIQRNDMSHSTLKKSIVLSNSPTQTTDALSYMAMSVYASPSELGSIEFCLPPNMVCIIEEVEHRVHAVLSIVTAYRDELADSCLSSPESFDTEVAKVCVSSAGADSTGTDTVSDEATLKKQCQALLLRDTLLYVKSCIFDSSTNKRLDYIEHFRTLSARTKEALRSDTPAPSLEFFLTTVASVST